MTKCLVCGKEYKADEGYIRSHGRSFARKMICSWECFNISVKVGNDKMNKQYEDLNRGKFKSLKVK
jgi:hypothetical protein